MVSTLNETLYGSVNSEGYSEDESNGGGVNWYLEVDLFDTAEVFEPARTDEHFWDDVDICIQGEKRSRRIPAERQVLMARER